MNPKNEHDSAKRRFLKTSAYAVPVILTLKSVPALATQGSHVNCNNGVGNGPDCDPKGLIDKPDLNNDDFGGTPGDPQNKGGPK